MNERVIALRDCSESLEWQPNECFALLTVDVNARLRVPTYTRQLRQLRYKGGPQLGRQVPGSISD